MLQWKLIHRFMQWNKAKSPIKLEEDAKISMSFEGNTKIHAATTYCSIGLTKTRPSFLSS
jgi:hypothetical protein